MKKVLYLILAGFLLSCSYGTHKKIGNNNDRIPGDTKNEQQIDAAATPHNALQGNNTDLKSKLFGVLWVSEEFKNSLYNSNSLTKAEKTITFYSDIVSDTNRYVYCNKPFFIEPDRLELRPDSSAIDKNGNFVFKIIEIDDAIIRIITAKDIEYLYNRIVKDNLGKLGWEYEAFTGYTIIKQQWIAGKYHITLDTLTMDATLKEDGKVLSDSNLKSIVPVSYSGKDLLHFHFGNNSMSFIIQSYSDTLITLKGIEALTDIDDPIVPNNKIGYMRKIVK